MADVSEIVDYYSNLLILQYNGLPNASAEIALLATTVLAHGIATDVQNAYDVDTAVGKQLDVIGKYVGVDRYYTQLDLTDFFSFVTYSQAGGLPSSPPQWGFTTYAAWANPSYNGTLTYAQIINSTNSLSDDDFRKLIKFQIIMNTSNYSLYEIDTALLNAFGSGVHAEVNGIMSIVYFIAAPLSALMYAMVFKGLLPKPMAVGRLVVENVQPLMFGMTDYADYAAGYESPFAYGFSTYSDYGTLAGQTLQYSQITVN